MISPIFTTIVISFLIIMAYMKITTNKFNTGDAAVLERERKANSTRRKSLDELKYISIPQGILELGNRMGTSGSDADDNEASSDGADLGGNAPGASGPSASGSSASGPSASSSGSDGSGNSNDSGESGGLANDPVLAADADKILALTDKKIVNFSGITNTDLKMEYGAANLPILTEYDQNFTALVQGLDSWAAHLIERNKVREARQLLEFAIEAGSDIKSTYTMLASIYAENFEFDKIDYLAEAADKLENSLMRRPIMRAMKEFSDVNNYISTKASSNSSDVI